MVEWVESLFTKEESISQSIFDRIGENEFAKILDGLGINHHGVGSSKRIPCPVHGGSADNFEIRWNKNIAQCYSGCAQEHFTIIELVEIIAGIKYSDVGSWIENVLDGNIVDSRDIKTSNHIVKKSDNVDILQPMVLEQYLEQKSFDGRVCFSFSLDNCEIWDNASNGWVSCVLMPTDANRLHEWSYRPRVRTSIGARFANKIRAGGITTDTKGLPARLYGIDQAMCCEESAHTIFIVEGESDVHALHMHGINNVVGIPGASWAKKKDLYGELVFAGFSENKYAIISEPGDAGQSFPARVREGMQLAGIRDPDISVINLKDNEYDDPCSAHMAMNSLENGFEEWWNKCIRSKCSLTQSQDSSSGTAWEQFSGTYTNGTPVTSEVGIGGSSFKRTYTGWASIKHSDSGEEILVDICSPIIPIQSVICGEEVYYDMALWHGPMQEWVTRRVPQSAILSSEGTSLLISMGLVLASPSRGMFTKLMSAILIESSTQLPMLKIHHGSGWQEDGSFSGVDSESDSHLVENIRSSRNNVLNQDVAVKTHYNAVRLLANPDKWNANNLATLACALAIGASCCAPIIHPARAANSPVILLHGIGGGGKTVVQSLAASIWVDKTLQQPVFFQANISQAALSALALDARDLPMIVDDVMQMPSKRDTDAARIKAFAELAMLVFNREPIKRAKRDGKLREGNPFRSPMIASAEQSLTSSNARLTTGQMRRIIQIEGRPMVACGVMGSENERKNLQLLEDAFYRDNSGVIGPRIINLIRGNDRMLHDKLKRWSQEAREANPDAEKTQMQTVALCCMGWELYLVACGVGKSDAENEALALLRIAAGVGGTATTSDEAVGASRAMESVSAYVASNRAFFQGQHGGSTSTQITKGRILDNCRVALLPSAWQEVERDYGITGAALRALADSGMLETQTESNGKIRLKKMVRIEGRNVRCYVFVLPDCEEEIDDDINIVLPIHIPVAGIIVDENDSGRQKCRHEGGIEGQEIQGTLLEATDISTEKIGHIDSDTNIYTESSYRIQLFGKNSNDIMTEGMIDRIVPINIDPRADRNILVDEQIIAWFSHATGKYRVISNDEKNNPKMLEFIRREALEEFETLKRLGDVNGVIVEDVPADDDPRWKGIDDSGPGVLSSAWAKANDSIRLDNGMLSSVNENYIKAYRVHILCRLRHPEWAIEEKND